MGSSQTNIVRVDHCAVQIIMTMHGIYSVQYWNTQAGLQGGILEIADHSYPAGWSVLGWVAASTTQHRSNPVLRTAPAVRLSFQPESSAPSSHLGSFCLADPLPGLGRVRRVFVNGLGASETHLVARLDYVDLI